jgi:SAM-dependent methyltransferase
VPPFGAILPPFEVPAGEAPGLDVTARAVTSLGAPQPLVAAPLAAWHTGLVMRDAWELHTGEWISWARAPGHDSYWRFHREAFLPLVPPPERLTLGIGCGEGRLMRDLSRLGHRVLGIDASPAMVTAAASVPGAAGWVAAGDAAALPVAAAADCAVTFMSLQDVDHMVLADTCERDGYTMTFHSQHRPLQAYTEALADAGFLIERIREVGDPSPTDKWHRIPLFLHIRALRS